MSNPFESDWKDFVRLFQCVMLEPKAFAKSLASELGNLKQCFASKERFAELFDDNNNRSQMLSALRDKVITSDLVHQHERLRRAVFPVLLHQNAFDEDLMSRRHNFLLNLYSYPEAFRTYIRCPTERENWIKGFVLAQAKKQAIIEKERDLLERLFDCR